MLKESSPDLFTYPVSLKLALNQVLIFLRKINNANEVHVNWLIFRSFN